jgi:hypothetical protein
LLCYGERDARDYRIEPNWIVRGNSQGQRRRISKLPEPNEAGDAIIDCYFFSRFQMAKGIDEISTGISPVLASEVTKRMGIQVQELDI